MLWVAREADRSGRRRRWMIAPALLGAAGAALIAVALSPVLLTLSAVVQERTGYTDFEVGVLAAGGRGLAARDIGALQDAAVIPNTVLAASDVTRRYGEGDWAVQALRGVSLAIPHGRARPRAAIATATGRGIAGGPLGAARPWS